LSNNDNPCHWPAAIRRSTKIRNKPGWEKRYHARLMEGWMLELPNDFVTTSVTALPNGEVWLLGSTGEVMAWKYHADIESALFINITTIRSFIGYQP